MNNSNDYKRELKIKWVLWEEKSAWIRANHQNPRIIWPTDEKGQFMHVRRRSVEELLHWAERVEALNPWIKSVSYGQKFPKRATLHNLDDTLLTIPLDGNVWDKWTLRDAVRGVQIFGGIGSGKSSGSGKTLAKTYLRMGYGGVVLTAKMDEADVWRKYAKDVGRDVEIFEDDGKFSFNPLQYEMDRQGGGDTFNLTNLLMSIYELGKAYSGGGSSGSSDRYWDDMLKLCISRMIALLKFSGSSISIENMRKILTTAPDKDGVKIYKEKQQPFKKAKEEKNRSKARRALIEFEKWLEKEDNFCLYCLENALYNSALSKDERDTCKLLKSFFLKEFADLSEKTRSIVETSFYGMVEPFMDGILKKYFTKDVHPAIRPEECYEKGKVIIINFPVKQYMVSGVYAQAIYKKLWQEAIERRTLKKDGTDLPVFLWVDEAQYFLGKDDAKFQTTARSSLACTVFITQNISNYYAAIGGKYPKETTDSLLGVLGTKIFHSNNDYVTNEWAANTIGKTFQLRQSLSSDIERLSGSMTDSEALNYQIEPEQFTTLASGGSENDNLVEGIMTVAGKRWSDGRNFAFMSFDQNITV